jgi:hypothetical protein
MNLFIFDNHKEVKDRKGVFLLSRPFLFNNKWFLDSNNLQQYGISLTEYKLVSQIHYAQRVIIPFPINLYHSTHKMTDLYKLNEQCKQNNIFAYGFISGDFGTKYTDFSNIIYFRTSGYKTKLSQKNKGFPVALSDHFQRIYNRENITPLTKTEVPIVGFCGHATLSFSKRIKEIIKCSIENTKRFFRNPLETNYEVLFASAYERAKVLSSLSKSDSIKTNFIVRKHYRAGAKSIQEREKTTLEYYNNILQSNYVVCMRGAGNFSVRFYETLLMGKIPVFINTDCLLPFEETINWKNHLVWIEWKDRKNIAQIVSNFHNKLSNEEFINLQIINRKLWKETLSVKNMLQTICNNQE